MSPTQVPAITLDQVNIAVQNGLTQIKNQGPKKLQGAKKEALVSTKSTLAIKGTNNASNILSAAKQSRAFYVGNVSPDCTESNILEYLTEKNIPVLYCEKLNSKQQHMASFKITVGKEQNEQTILDSNLWPVDIIIKPFIFSRTNRYYKRNFHSNRPRRMQI